MKPIFLLAACLVASLAKAADSGAIILRNDGLTALGRGNWTTAAAVFTAVVTAHPDDVDAWILLGIARWHQGRKGDCLDALDKALAGRSTPLESRARYYRALTLSALGRDTEATEAFAELVNRCPHSAEAAKVRAAVLPPSTPNIISTKTPPTAEDHWRLTATQSLGYDSNPYRLNQDLIDDPRSDLMADTYAGLHVTPVPQRVGIYVAARSEKYFHFDDLDVVTVLGGAWVGLVANNHDELTLGAESSRTWMGHEPFRWRHAALGSWWHAFDAAWSSRVDVAAATIRHDQEEDGALDGIETRADAALGWDAGVGAVLRSIRGRIGAGYGSAERRDLASTQVDASVDSLWRLGPTWSLEWTIAGGTRQFAAGSSTNGGRRTDTWTGAGLSLIWQVAKWCSCTAQGYGQRTWTNVAWYEHDLALASAGVRLEW